MLDSAPDNSLDALLGAALRRVADAAPDGPNGARVLRGLRRRTIRRVLVAAAACVMSIIVLAVAAGPIMLAMRTPAVHTPIAKREPRRPSLLVDPPTRVAANLNDIGVEGGWRWSVPLASDDDAWPAFADAAPIVRLDPTLRLDWQRGLLENPILVGILAKNDETSSSPWEP